METRFTPAGDDDSSDNRNEGDVGEPSLPLESHKVGKDGGEEGRGGANSLVERHREVTEGNVAEDDRDTEDEAESGDLEELNPGSNGLHRDHLHPGDGDVAEQRAGGHVAHGEEDRVLEAIVAQQVLVQQQNPNVGGVPGGDEPDREKPARALHLGALDSIGRLRLQPRKTEEDRKTNELGRGSARVWEREEDPEHWRDGTGNGGDGC